MESLSEVLKHLPESAYLRQTEERVKLLLNDPLVLKWRAKHPDATDADLALHMNRLYQYVKEYKTCKHCPGLERCPNDLPGHYTKLTAEKIRDRMHIYDEKVACKKHIAKEAQDAVRKRIRSFYVDERSLNEGYVAEEIASIDAERAEAVRAVFKYIFDTQKNGLKPRGLYLAGPLGTGKTFLMCYMLHELAKTGLTGVIVYMPDFAEDLKAMFQEPQKLKDTIDLLKETDLLVFDDIGAENMNPWLRDHVLGTILNYRMNRKPTFFTSNHELDDLERHFSFTSREGEEEFKGRRIMDRIRHFVEVVEVQGFNKRGKGSTAS